MRRQIPALKPTSERVNGAEREWRLMAGLGRMCVSRLRAFHLSGEGSQRSKNPKVPDLSDGRRPAQDEFGDVLGQECSRDVAWDPVYDLRWNLKDERARIAFEAVFVADSIIHVCAGRPVALQVVDVAFDERF